MINLAIVGATGLVGNTFLKVLEEKDYIKIDKFYVFASHKSEGQILSFRGKEYKVMELSEKNLKNKKIDFALFSAGTKVSKDFAPYFKKLGIIVIDNSNAWRMQDDVPLVVPQVNPNDAFINDKIISNPNCSTIQCVLPLYALHDKYILKSVHFCTMQSVSGSGIKGLKDLENTKNGLPPEFYPYAIYNNCLPHIDVFLDNSYTKEEMKMVNETRKIMHLPNLPISATCVRVPVESCHSIDIVAEFEKEFLMTEVLETLKNFPHIIVIDDVKNNIYPINTIAKDKNEVFVGRIRRDLANDKAIRLFVVADNIRKGAATNAIEILEEFL